MTQKKVGYPDNFLHNNRIQELINWSPLIGSADDPEATLPFRRLLECAFTQGRWFGKVAEVS
jgi:hypothetical protein